MTRRQWKSETMAMIVLEGLKGLPVAELCYAHQISQAQYDQWGDQFVANANRAFDTQTLDQHLTHVQRANAQLKTVFGDLTVDQKKTRRGDEARAICERARAITTCWPPSAPHESGSSLLGLSPPVSVCALYGAVHGHTQAD